MTRRNLLALAISVCVLTPAVLAQVANASLLRVEIENHRIYRFDVDPSKYGSSSTSLSGQTFGGGPTGGSATSPFCNFTSYLAIGDLVSINGTPVKGTVFEKISDVSATPAPAAGQCQAIADITRGTFYEWNLEIMNQDGTYLGSVLAQGLAGGGPSPPGAPSSVTRGGYMVVGGTGAFLGVRGGYFQNTPDASVPVPITSAAENPSLRRTFGGGKTHATLYLIPLSPPQVAMTASGPAITHSTDFTLVNSSKPAAPGEILSLFATGLGPTRPTVDPGKAFPSQPLASVVAPVSVTVNGVSAEVLGAVGYPGATDGYQVNFRVPSGVSSGAASIQVNAAWIAGPEVKIAIQ